MTPEGLARMQSIFEAAVECPVSEREAYLSRACGKDAELRANVERLIEADDDTDTVGGPLDDLPGLNIKECSQCSRCFDEPIRTCPIDGTRLVVVIPGPLLIDGKYRVERCLGRGGMGAVYLVKHTLLEKYFALKVITTDGPIPESYRKNFETEALALGRLKHPNIVDVTDSGVDPRGGGLPYLVMEYLEGRTVRQMLQERHWLPFPEALALLRSVAAAIDCAHEQNIVHGDLKPSNLFIARQPDGREIVKVVDFGLARLGFKEDQNPAFADVESRTRSTVSDAVRGTPAYMAPELFRRDDPSPPSDLFAFGVLTYEILTGTQPFGRHALEVLEKLRHPAPRPSVWPPDLPEELDSPILSLLDRNPEQRRSSASAAVSTMEAKWLCAGQRKWRERELPARYWYAVIAAAIAVLIAGWLASWRVVRILESRTVDDRFALAAKRPPDPRLLVVVLDDNAIAGDPRPIAQWDDKFTDLTERILAGGARGVVLDFLLPPSWSGSQKFAQLVARHADRIELAIFSDSGNVVGTECIGPLTAHVIGPARYSALFGFANLEEDEDRRIRRARPAYADRQGKMRPSLANRAISVASLSPVGSTPRDRPAWIDYSVSPRDIPRVSWTDAGARPPAFFKDKLVMIGADYAGSNDRHRVPATADPDWVSGILIHAMIANTIAQNFQVRDPDLATCLAFAVLACFGIIALALRFPHKPSLAIVAAAGLFIGYALFGFLIFRSSQVMLILVAPETALLLSMILAWRLRSRLDPYPVKGA